MNDTDTACGVHTGETVNRRSVEMSSEEKEKWWKWGEAYKARHSTVEAIEEDLVDGIFPPGRRLQADIAKLLGAEWTRRGLDREQVAAIDPSLNLTADDISFFENLGGLPDVDFMARYAAALGLRITVSVEPLTWKPLPPLPPDSILNSRP